MATNPLIAQGTLNRLRAHVVWTAFPALNVTASYLGKEGVRLALEGESTTFIPTMAGAVTSPEPYMQINLTINLLKTQPLANLYKAQLEQNALIGTGTVWPDVTTLAPYNIINCAIESVRELAFSGEDPLWAVAIKGYYLVNSNLWDI
jgi:hypothetical protein